MNLSTENLNALCESAINAATKAGEYIAQTRPINVERKTGGDTLASQVVTEVDKQSEELILQTLEPTFEQYDLALLTEETDDDGSRLVKDFFWCIDPIDGTLPFIEGTPGYAVSIALVSRDGIPTIGVVFDPVTSTLYHAVKGGGAFRNNAPFQIGKSAQPAALSLITDRSVAESAEYPQILSGLDEIARDLHLRSVKTKTLGGGVMNAIWVLENPPACYFKFPKKQEGGGSSWDFAATACIYAEIGAPATDIFGQPLKLNQPDTLFMNRDGALFATDEALSEQVQTLYRKLT